MADWYSIVYMYHLSIHSSVKGHLGYFHVLAIVNSAATNTGVHVSFRTIFFSGYMPRIGVARSYASSIFSFLRNFHTVVHSGYMKLHSKVIIEFVTIFLLLLLLFSHKVVSDSWPHGLQHARLPCSLPFPGNCPSSCPLNWWCHPTISSCHPLLLPLIFPTSGSFPVSQLFTSGGQSNGAPASTSVLPESSGLISFKIDCFDLLAFQGTLKSLLQNHSLKASILQCSAFFIVHLSQ